MASASRGRFPRPVTHAPRRAPSRTLTAALAVLVGLAGLAAPAAIPTAAASSPSRDVVEETGVSLAVTEVSPTTVTPEDTVTVGVVVTNNGPTALDGAQVTWSIVRYRLATAAILDNWFNGTEPLTRPAELARVTIEGMIEPGASRTVQLSVPAQDLGLLSYPEASGPRGLILEVLDAGGTSLDLARTFLLWFPAAEIEPVRLSILVPITGPAPTPLDAGAWAEAIAQETGDGGRLQSLLEATGGDRAVTWAVDPALVDEAGDAGPSAVWAEKLLASAVGREVFALPGLDPDVAALAHAGSDEILAATQDSASALGWRTDLTLPVDDAVDATTLAAAARLNRPLVVVRSGLEPEVASTAALTGLATVASADGTVSALLPDAELSRLLTEPDALDLASDVEVRQLMLARLAVISQETATEPVHLLLATDRAWEPDVAAVRTLLEGLSEADFVSLQPLSSLVGAAEPAVVRQSPEELVVGPDELDPGTVGRLTDQLAAVRALATTTADPEALVDDYLTGVLATTSAAWRSDPTGRAEQVAAVTGLGAGLLGSVSVVPGSVVNLISASGDLPVTIRNDLPQAVTVGISLVPDDRRLSVEDVPQVTIEPGSSVAAVVPVTAIGSGDVDVTVQILAPDGSVVATSSGFRVRVRADWENVGTAVLAGLLAVGMALGIVRTVRRGKGSTRLAPVSPDEDAP